MPETSIDLLVIGGGVNGAGIARNAAGRSCARRAISGCEGTSSRSGKLIHGGLRYLEYYEFRLVRETLIEREVSCSRRRRTSSGRCASSCRTRPSSARPG